MLFMSNDTGRYICKRILLAFLTVFIIAAITFFAMNAIPGGPFSQEKAPSPAVQAVLEQRFHLDKPLTEQFGLYLSGIMQGDFGISTKTGRDISTTIFSKFSISATLGGWAVVTRCFLGWFWAPSRRSTATNGPIALSSSLRRCSWRCPALFWQRCCCSFFVCSSGGSAYGARPTRVTSCRCSPWRSTR
jgi:hypothetical protein